MLRKPDLSDNVLVLGISEAYVLHAADVAFLPLGADPDTVVYRVVSSHARAYFVKQRSGRFDRTAVAVPHLPHQRGISQVVPPLSTWDGRPVGAR